MKHAIINNNLQFAHHYTKINGKFSCRLSTL